MPPLMAHFAQFRRAPLPRFTQLFYPQRLTVYGQANAFRYDALQAFGVLPRMDRVRGFCYSVASRYRANAEKRTDVKTHLSPNNAPDRTGNGGFHRPVSLVKDDLVFLVASTRGPKTLLVRCRTDRKRQGTDTPAKTGLPCVPSSLGSAMVHKSRKRRATVFAFVVEIRLVVQRYT